MKAATRTIGRPKKNPDDVIRRTDDGHEITAGDTIVASLAIGNYFEQACAAAGLSKDTVYGWLREGARITQEVTAGRTSLPRRGSRDRQLVDFSDAVGRAEAEWEVRSNETLERLGQPREVIEVRETQELDPETGELRVTKSVTTTRVEEADSATIRWRLERRFPSRYGKSIELSGGLGDASLPVPVRERAAGAVRQAVAQLAANTASLLGDTEGETDG